MTGPTTEDSGAEPAASQGGDPALFADAPNADASKTDAAPDAGAGTPAEAYRVLARKYRPATFDALIGQEPMVRTLSNAFSAGRIPQAWMLTGVRGVGKTTTARILARALNYDTPDGDGAPTVDLPAGGIHCQAIMEGRHVDVIEMDAASHTGIADIREITDAARYRPVSARYKVYIIDEVHMLSTQAFNGLLKTLEEPPPHVKFVFATTEIRKVPITVLSRCQRFDLRRVPGERLVEHLSGIGTLEGVTAEPEALRLIARAAEGSVRDALSLFDQAIAHGAGLVTADGVKAMLGLADRTRVIDLFDKLVSGDVAAALDELQTQHAVGADPAVVLTDLAAFVHLITRLKVAPGGAVDGTATEEEVVRGRAHAASLSVPALGRLWQGLLKGIDEVQAAAMPVPAAEMVLVRLAYLSTLPTPEEALRRLAPGADGAPAAARSAERAPAGAAPVAAGPAPAGAMPPEPPAAVAPTPLAHDQSETADEVGGAPTRPAGSDGREPAGASPRSGSPRLRSLNDVAALAGERRVIKFKIDLERFVRPVRFEEGRIEIALVDGAPSGLVGEIGARLMEWTGDRWVVTVANADGGETLAEEAARTKAAAAAALENDPLVKAALATFPGARIVDVRINAPDEEAAVDALDDPDAADEDGAASDPPVPTVDEPVERLPDETRVRER